MALPTTSYTDKSKPTTTWKLGPLPGYLISPEGTMIEFQAGQGVKFQDATGWTDKTTPSTSWTDK